DWRSNLSRETDPETEEVVCRNSMKMIDLIQLPTIDERRNFSLYKEIIKDNWPVLLFFGINESKNLYEQTEGLLQKEYRGLKIIRNRNLDITEKNGDLNILPKSYQISLNNNYNFVIENKNSKVQKIKIESEYSKEEARGLIRVLIRQNGKFEEFDILDLNKGKEYEIGKSPLSINVFYNKEYTSESWKKAGKLIIKK